MTNPASGRESSGTGNAREVALDVLYEILEKGAFSHLVLGQALSKYQYLGKHDRAFITRVTEGTLEYLLQLDFVLGQYSSVPVKKMKPLIRTLLRMSAYQILYMDRVPDAAVCSEAVKLARKRRFQGLTGFVNGVLRTLSREKEKLEFPDDSIRFSVPSWLLELWNRELGPRQTRQVLAYFLEEHPLMVRCCPGAASRDAILASLQSQGVSVREHPLLEEVLILEKLDYLEALEAFQKGWIQVQDLSSVLVGRAAAPAPGAQVLDVCGAPGGKALHIAQLLNGTGHVEVRDISPVKVQRIQENIRRLGVSNLSASVRDALDPDPSWKDRADLVVADLPCSGLGVLGRKPDIKWRVTPESLDSLAGLQRQILSVVWQYVKPGGILIYSTCTIDRKENEDNRDWFLGQFPFRPVSLEGRLGEKLKAETLKEGYIQLLPGIWPCDGFFLSVMQRI